MSLQQRKRNRRATLSALPSGRTDATGTRRMRSRQVTTLLERTRGRQRQHVREQRVADERAPLARRDEHQLAGGHGHGDQPRACRARQRSPQVCAASWAQNEYEV